MSRRGSWPLGLIGIVAGCAPLPQPVRPMAEGYRDCEHPDWPRARASVSAGDLQTAVALLPEVLATCPQAVPVHRLWQDVAMRLGGDVEARMRAGYAAMQDDGGPLTPYLRSRLESSSARRLDLLETALSRDSSFVFALVDVGAVWLDDGKPENAVTSYERAVRAAPASVAGRLGLARCLELLGRFAEAAPHYRAAVDAGADDRQVLLDFARLLIYRLERADEARPLVERLLDEAPEDVAARMHAAALAWLRGDREAAAAGYRRVLEIEPTNARAALNLGNLYYEGPDPNRDGVRADWDRARKAYRYFLTLSVGDDVHDLHDARVAVPERLARIAELLGPAQGPVPRPGGF